ARASTVREPGDFAIRGGLVDIFPPGGEQPLRLDLFGDTLESIRTFDAETQRTIGQQKAIDLAPVSEALLNKERASHFRATYVAAFGAVTDDDPLYEAISAVRKHQGMEHWLPLFYERLDTLFDYCGDAPLVFLDHLAEEAMEERLSSVGDYYAARKEDRASVSRTSAFSAPAYKPLQPEQLYLAQAEAASLLAEQRLRVLSPFSAPDAASAVDLGAKQGRSFAAERAGGDGVNVFEAAVAHIEALQKAGKRVAVAAWTEGSADRMASVLGDYGLSRIAPFTDWRAFEAEPKGVVGQITLGLEHGVEADDFALVAEQDILGDRMIRRSKKRRAENFLTEASSLSAGDLVVHVEHGVGRYDGLEAVEVHEAPHDCLRVLYAGGDKLYLPVENIELLSRYGSDDPAFQLDKLGGAGWQSRKARLRERIKMMAEELIKIAAAREMKTSEVMTPPSGAYDEFCARFPYPETEDQEAAIADVLEDLGKGRPMDRLVCGDVGFGKTEVALRAAFVAAMAGRQVAVIAPTTLLARQHYKGFAERFAGFPVKVRQLSRLVTGAEASEVRAGVADGQVDIVIGTHALLSKTITFRDLGLLIVDEEQHFGVKHKERLKTYRADTHVLTLTATPIPRTLQLAMSGIRDLSIIATPPVDRLAVRTAVGPFDAVMVREALLREHYRGGQSFYVCPRITDLKEAGEFLAAEVPEVKYVLAHGQMGGAELEDIMTAFYEGKYEVLVSTTIIESGLDIPTANTLIVHRADMFGLAQLYQIRGRVGRSKARAYAYLTTPPKKTLTASAEKRLKVLQSLDTLGAGFNLASHDLDIRGGGNLLGEEQSGQVKEVGVELYQHMLEEAVAALREGGAAAADEL
ncbi:MAG: transcription-repair coupling factor, partial [Pseudomonadota bacterium]